MVWVGANLAAATLQQRAGDFGLQTLEDLLMLGRFSSRIFLSTLPHNKQNLRENQKYYAAPIGAFFCLEIRALTGFGGRDFFTRFQSP